MNDIKTWRQGRFIDGAQYNNWNDKSKAQADFDEQFLVRSSPKGNAICKCNYHDDAKWIADRLNLASELEELVYSYSKGDKSGIELIEFVKTKLKAI